MKIAAYSYRDFDEAKYFEKFSARYGVEIIPVREAPGVENAVLAAGCRGVSILTTPVTEEVIRAWKEQGVEHISTRTVGYDHVDVEAVRKYGMALSNVTYSTGSVADYTVMLILMAVRRMKSIIKRAEGMDYSLPGNIGREMKDLTVGVVGTGKIGIHVMRNLSGFGCRILASSPHEKEEARQYGTYCSLEQLFRDSDVITFHVPAGNDTFHMVNRETIAAMKDGVVLVVIEHEIGIYYGDYKYQVIGHREMSILKDMPNVLMLPHMAFYTENAISDMVENSILHILKGDGSLVQAAAVREEERNRADGNR